jgi:hypothetical protein
MSESVKESLAGASSAALAAALGDDAPTSWPDKTYSSRRQVAQRFGVATRTIRRWEKIRGFPEIRYFNRRGYFDDQELACYEKQHFRARLRSSQPDHRVTGSAPLEREAVPNGAP